VCLELGNTTTVVDLNEPALAQVDYSTSPACAWLMSAGFSGVFISASCVSVIVSHFRLAGPVNIPHPEINCEGPGQDFLKATLSMRWVLGYLVVCVKKRTVCL
jgi:hypothetical protein